METERCLFRSWRVAAALCALVACGVAAHAAGRTAIMVSAGEKGADWQTVLTAGLLAARPATELVERGELARAWAERERAALTAKPETGLAVSAVVTVERYLHFRLVGDGRWIVELVDAESGRALGSVAVDAAELGVSSRLVTAAAGLLDAPAPAGKPRAVKVAVVESVEAAGNAELFGLAVRLRAALADSGLVVLDRALTQELAVERNDAKRGFRAGETDGFLLGLDYWIELTPRNVRLMRVGDGVVILVKELPSGENAVGTLRDWALPHLGVPASKVEPYQPQVEIEALEPFFRGIALHDTGHFAEASAEFTRAYRINGRFREAYEWAARCYDAMGIPEMAVSMRRYLAVEFLENLPAATGRVTPVDGLAFLGVEAAEENLAPLQRDVSAIAASALAARADIGLRMPDQLARLHREYDWMSVGGAESGYGLEATAGLFTRTVLSGRIERKEGRIVIQWTLRDSLGLQPPLRRAQSMAADPQQWPVQLRNWLADWPSAKVAATGGSQEKREAVKSVEAPEMLAKKMGAARGEEREVVRLALLRAKPDHPLAVVRGPGKADEPLTSFLDYGRREYAIRCLPADNSQRRWFELMRALDHFNLYAPAGAYAGRALDTRAELKRLIEAQPGDGPGLAARFYQLYLDPGAMTAAELAAACRLLRTELDARPDRIDEIFDDLAPKLENLGRVAEMAAGEIVPENAVVAFDKFAVPTESPVLSWNANGRLVCTLKTRAISRLPFAGLEGDDQVRNARAQLAIMHRGHKQMVYDRAWLTAYPRTPALAFFVAMSLSDAGDAYGMPMSDPQNWAAQNAHLKAGVEYVMDTIEDGFGRYTHPSALKNMSLLATSLAGVEGNPRMRECVTAEEQTALLARMVAARTAAQGRVPFKAWDNPNAYALPELTATAIREAFADNFDYFPLWVPRADRVKEALLTRGLEFTQATKPTDPANWWSLVRRWETNESLTAPDRAALLATHTDDVLRLATDNPDDGSIERLFDFGLMLHYGRRDAEAERVFVRLAGLSLPQKATRRRTELMANALFRLAQLQRIAGRHPEALVTAGRGLTLAIREDLTFYEQQISYVHNKGGLASQFSRLLTELRLDPDRVRLPERVECVRVPTANGDNPLLSVYYRRPPAQAGLAADARHRVLVIGPVTNQDALDYLMPESPWARFADEHGLVLVVPRFCVSDRIFRYDHRFTHAHFAEAWSGDAVLRALDEIEKRVPLEKNRLLVHGQTSGAGFATHFAAWCPERVQAVTVVNGNWSLFRLNTTGVQPPAAQRHVRYWVGASPWDNHFLPITRPRFSFAQEFAARMRDAGVAVTWTEWPDETHLPSAEMEAAARAFLARQLTP